MVWISVLIIQAIHADNGQRLIDNRNKRVNEQLSKPFMTNYKKIICFDRHPIFDVFSFAKINSFKSWKMSRIKNLLNSKTKITISIFMRLLHS